jgi:hypothetical protein
MSDDFKNTGASVEAMENLDHELRELRLARERNNARQNSETVVSIARGMVTSRKIIFIGIMTIFWILLMLFLI